MTATFQPGTHPDVENLSAFAEQALGEHERSQLLAHLAVCPRCRQIVLLATEPVAEEIHLAAAAVQACAARRSAWQKPWVFAAAPLAALAASAIFALFLHHARVEQDAELAKNTPPSSTRIESLTATPSPSDREHFAPPPPQATLESKKRAAAAEPELDRATEARQRSAVARPPTAAPPLPPPAPTEAVIVAAAQPSIETVSPNQASEIGQSTTTQSHAVLKTPSLPASRSAMQQSQASQQQAFQDANASVQSRQNVSSTRFAGAFQAKTSPAGLHGSAGAAATNANAPTTMSSAAAISQAPLAPTADSSATSLTRFGTFDSVTAVPANASVNRHFHLPGGRTSISVASSGRRMVAIDSTGAGFLSLNSGVTWQPVATQWAGRAVLVRIVPNPFAAAASPATASASGQAATATSTFTFFEILNDQNQTWRSIDGVTWLAK